MKRYRVINNITETKRCVISLIVMGLVAMFIFTACIKKENDAAAGSSAWWQETIAYEIYVKSFKDSDGDGCGDINGITSELDYLKELGVGAIWLTPCYLSPQADNGYDISDYYTIDPAYGTMEDMERLIKEAGKRDKADAGDGMVSIHTMTANTDGILDYLREFRSSVQDGTDIFTVGEANGVSASELPDWIGPDGVVDMVFEFGHVNIDIKDEFDWCSRREWTLPEFKALFSHSQKATAETGRWYPMYLENHDQPRSISHFLPEGADRTAGGKVLATLLLTMRGTPFIMQGEELGYVNVEWPSIDDYDDISTKNHYYYAISAGYSEEEAMDGVHHFSRDSARTPMQWDSSDNAGFTGGTPCA